MGRFEVALEPDYSAVSGEVTEGVVPSSLWVEVQSEGPCQLLHKENPFCNPSCEPGTICDHDGRCVPHPRELDIGAIRVDGLAVAVEMQPAEPGNEYYFTDLPHPAVDPASPVRLTADGGELGEPLQLAARGVGLVAVESDTEIARGEDFQLRWEQQGGTMRMTLNIDQHGDTPVTLACQVPDEGQVTVPAVLVDALFDSGVSGFPSVHVYRESVDSTAAGNGCVELRVFAHVRARLAVRGHMPCDRDSDCDEGSCDVATNTCR